LDHVIQDPASVSIAEPVNPGFLDDLDLSITTGAALDFNSDNNLEQFSGPRNINMREEVPGSEPRPAASDTNFDDDLEQFSGPTTGNINMHEDVPENLAQSTPSLPRPMINDLDDYLLSQPGCVPNSLFSVSECSPLPAPPVLSEHCQHAANISRSQPGGPTEPIKEAFRCMNTKSDIQQSRHSDSMIDPELLNLFSGSPLPEGEYSSILRCMILVLRSF